MISFKRNPNTADFLYVCLANLLLTILCSHAVCVSVCGWVCVCVSVCLCVCVCLWVCVCLVVSVWGCVFLRVRLFVCLSLGVCETVCVGVCVSVCVFSPVSRHSWKGQKWRLNQHIDVNDSLISSRVRKENLPIYKYSAASTIFLRISTRGVEMIGGGCRFQKICEI